MPNPEHILLALDASPVLQLLERALRAGSYNISIAQDQDSLDRILLETSPAIMVIGETLKGKDGCELSARVLERFPTLPIIMFAEKESQELLKKGLRTGLSNILFPPLRIDEIVEAIKHSLRRAQGTGDWIRREVKRTTTSLEKRVEELETMVRLGRFITGSLDLENVLSSVVSTAVALTGAEEGSLLLLDQQTGELYVRAERNLGQVQARTLRLKVEDSLAGQVIRTGEPIFFSDSSPQKIKTAYLVNSLIYVPVRLQDKMLGVLGVDNRQSNRPFRDHYVLLLSLLADYAATALENTRLYQESEDERNKLNTILNNIDDGVIVLDAEKHILYINGSARRTFGLGIGDLVGKALFDIIRHPDMKAMLEDLDQNPLKHNEIAFEDGRTFNAQYAPITGIGSAITLQEITHLKMLDRLKNDFIHTVSHDLRSPLTAIMGYVELLDRIGPLNDQQKEFVRRVQASVQNITTLVNDLLDLGRIEAGFDTRKDLVAMDGILRYTLDNYYNQISDKHIKLRVEIPEGILPVLGNPIRLRQMLDNLVGNAVKYDPEGGLLSIKIEIEGGQLITSIEDSGVGIPLSDQPHIFEKFYRASNAPKSVPGTGLGLAIVKSIVDSHQGRIWVESKPGEGSIFIVVLPLYRSDVRDTYATNTNVLL
jgi:two-component system phosphate regulon sensor histidine kinase PhoR